MVHDMAIDTSTPLGRLFFSMVGAFAEFERGLIAERVKDGLTYAKAHGTKSGRAIGRPRARVDLWSVLDTVCEGKYETVAAQARRLGICRATLYRIMADAGYRWEAGVGWVSESPSAEIGVSA